MKIIFHYFSDCTLNRQVRVKDMNGFEKRKAMIKGNIMKTTMVMLRTLEPKRLRIADIAKEAEVSQVTIYNYFGSKEELLKESFKDFIQRAIREFEEEMLKQQSLRELISYTIFKEKETYYNLSPALIKEVLFDDPEMYAFIQEQYDTNILPLMVKMLEDGKASGEISDKVSVEAFLMIIQVYMKSSEEMLGAMEKHKDKTAFLDELLHLIFYGLCGQELPEV